MHMNECVFIICNYEMSLGMIKDPSLNCFCPFWYSLLLNCVNSWPFMAYCMVLHMPHVPEKLGKKPPLCNFVHFAALDSIVVKCKGFSLHLSQIPIAYLKILPEMLCVWCKRDHMKKYCSNSVNHPMRQCSHSVA